MSLLEPNTGIAKGVTPGLERWAYNSGVKGVLLDILCGTQYHNTRNTLNDMINSSAYTICLLLALKGDAAVNCLA